MKLTLVISLLLLSLGLVNCAKDDDKSEGPKKASEATLQRLTELSEDTQILADFNEVVSAIQEANRNLNDSSKVAQRFKRELDERCRVKKPDFGGDGGLLSGLFDFENIDRGDKVTNTKILSGSDCPGEANERTTVRNSIKYNVTENNSRIDAHSKTSVRRMIEFDPRDPLYKVIPITSKQTNFDSSMRMTITGDSANSLQEEGIEKARVNISMKMKDTVVYENGKTLITDMSARFGKKPGQAFDIIVNVNFNRRIPGGADLKDRLSLRMKIDIAGEISEEDLRKNMRITFNREVVDLDFFKTLSLGRSSSLGSLMED